MCTFRTKVLTWLRAEQQRERHESYEGHGTQSVRHVGHGICFSSTLLCPCLARLESVFVSSWLCLVAAVHRSSRPLPRVSPWCVSAPKTQGALGLAPMVQLNGDLPVFLCCNMLHN